MVKHCQTFSFLIHVEDIIAIIEERVVLNYRNVSRSIIKIYIEEDDDE